MIFLRNLETGEIREVDPFSPEHAEIRHERYELNGKSYYVWEQTSAPDARPEEYAHPDEVAARRRHRLDDLSKVTADGTPTSLAATEELKDVDPGNDPVDVLERDPADPSKGPRPKNDSDESQSSRRKRSSSD